MGPLRGHDGTGAIVVAAVRAPNYGVLGACRVTTMGRLTQTTGVRRRSHGLQRHRSERPGKREQKQKSGGQALHVF